MNWLRKLLKSKIHITVIMEPDSPIHHTPPSMSPPMTPVISTVKKSNFRFCSHQVVKPSENKNATYYYTEKYEDGRWERVDGTWTNNKAEAMIKHLDVLNGADYNEYRATHVIWEGLSKEETESWVALNQ